MTRAPTYTLHNIPNGPSGTAATLDLMNRLVKKYKQAPDIRELALHLTKHLPQKDGVGEVKAIHRFVQNRIRYIKDIDGIETLQTPLQTLRIGQGDCDDKATLVGALLGSIGHPSRFRAIGFMRNSFCHVYPETKLGGQWVSVETTEPVDIGWRPRGVAASMVRNGRR